jgi:FMN phosphatase YigB (HAD superfamily)
VKKFRNIIFDLGGIFIELDYNRTEQAFISLGVTNFNQLFTQHKASSLFQKLETGHLSATEFYEAVRLSTHLPLRDEQIKNAWNAMLGGFPPERLGWLKKVGAQYNVYLFSNTNVIHYDRCQQIFRESTGSNNFDDYFIKAWYSHKLGIRKPNVEAFQKLVEMENLKAEETLFIDDTPINIEGAKLAGLQTILLQPPKTVLDLSLND